MRKKILLSGAIALIISVSSLISANVITVRAEDDTGITKESEMLRGTCGDNLEWKFENGTLTISGTGEMYERWRWSGDTDGFKTSVEKVVIENGVTQICESAFSYFDALKYVEISESVTEIGNGAFSDCENLEKLDVCEENIVYDSRNNCNAIIDTDTNMLIAGCQNTIIPSDIKHIGDYAFDGCTKIKNIEIPNELQSIGKSAFSGCISLESITLPDSVESIGSRAFTSCRKLITINIPTSFTEVTTGYNYSSFFSECFRECRKLQQINVSEDSTKYKSIDGVLFDKNTNELLYCPEGKKGEYIVPKGTTSIHSYAFAFNRNLSKITISEGNERIGENAFYQCESLTCINIPISTSDIEVDGINYCLSLSEINVDKNNMNYTSDSGVLYDKKMNTLIRYPNSKAGSYKIPNSVSKIAYDSMNACINLTSLVVPESIVTIEGAEYCAGAFDGASGEFVIICTENSYAHKYALEYNYKLKFLDNTPKQVNGLVQKNNYKTSIISMKWKKVEDVDGYEVYRALSKNGRFKKVANVVTNSLTDKKLTSGKNYYYKVRAYKTKGTKKEYGSYSYTVMMSTITTTPQIKLVGGTRSAKVIWNKLSGADGYEVYMSSSKNGKYQKIRTISSKHTFYVKKKLKNNKNYYFKVRTYRRIDGNKVYSAFSGVRTIKVK